MKYALVQEIPYKRQNYISQIQSCTDLPTRLVEIAISDSYEALEELQKTITKNNKNLKDCKIIER